MYQYHEPQNLVTSFICKNVGYTVGLWKVVNKTQVINYGICTVHRERWSIVYKLGCTYYKMMLCLFGRIHEVWNVIYIEEMCSWPPILHPILPPYCVQYCPHTVSNTAPILRPILQPFGLVKNNGLVKAAIKEVTIQPCEVSIRWWVALLGGRDAVFSKVHILLYDGHMTK